VTARGPAQQAMQAAPSPKIFVVVRIRSIHRSSRDGATVRLKVT
jgi:hypothetical protein